MDNRHAIALLQQQVEAIQADMNRQFDAIFDQLAAMLPPEDDKRQQELRQRKSWKGFISNAFEK
jgi:hypothetical protein